MGEGPEVVDTLVIGGGQAGLATSYWLRRAGIEHLVLEGRDQLGGSWPDRWDGFHLVAPNFTLQLPGMPYDGPEPDAFMARDDVIRYVRSYAAAIGAPVRLGTPVRRLAPPPTPGGGFAATTDSGVVEARTVVLATGAYPNPKVPAAARDLPDGIQQLHSRDYRRPAQLADGAVLVVGSGQSGVQIAEELHGAGRQVHLAVSMCGSVPRRYRGRDVIWWLASTFLHGEEHGVHFPTVDDLPSPAARFTCNPQLSGVDGGHTIDLRRFARDGIRLYGRLEGVDGGTARFSDDLAERLAFADSQFDLEFRPLFAAYAAAAGIDAPPDDRPPPGDFTPEPLPEPDQAAPGLAAA